MLFLVIEIYKNNILTFFFFIIIYFLLIQCFNNMLAGRTTTNDELEEMLEQGNPAVFTQGVNIKIN